MLPVMVTYNHPITLSTYQTVVRQRFLSILNARLSRLGLDSFFYTRPVGQNTREFLLERRAFQDSFLDMENFTQPSLQVPTVYYNDVNAWIRYCRKYFDRNVHCNTFRDKRINPYLKTTSWKNVHGVESSFPDSAYTPSFKYWITSEYGPGTLRPHYHGVLMGVDEEMFRDVFAPWWRKHFGDGYRSSVVYSVYDPQKGGAMYIAKYCSKGSFDHPLVTKAIHYPSGEEFISNKYINCIKWFGCNFPLTTPPFRLISKGIGVRYPFKASIQKYWDVQCDEFTKFVCKDSQLREVPLSFFHELDQGLTVSVSSSGDVGFRSPAAILADRYRVAKIESRTRPKVLKVSDIVINPAMSEDDFLQFQNTFFNKQYIRHYVYKNESKTYSCLIPRYYRRFLLSPFTQTAVASVARVRSHDDSCRELRQIKLAGCQDSQDAALRQVSLGYAYKQSLSEKKIAERYGRFYSKPFVGDETAQTKQLLRSG